MCVNLRVCYELGAWSFVRDSGGSVQKYFAELTLCELFQPQYFTRSSRQTEIAQHAMREGDEE